MTKTITGKFDSAGKVQNALDDLLAAGIDREKVYADKDTNEIKVMIPSAIEREITEILNRHGPTQVR